MLRIIGLAIIHCTKKFHFEGDAWSSQIWSHTCITKDVKIAVISHNAIILLRGMASKLFDDECITVPR